MMHQYLSAVGLRKLKTRQDLQRLLQWVTEAPDVFRAATLPGGDPLAMATRFFAGDAGISVVGGLDETGAIIPEWYFPCLKPDFLTSDEPVTVERKASGNGYLGMSDDYRFGMSLIFHVQNVTEMAKQEQKAGGPGFSMNRASLGLLLSDATVLLPISEDAEPISLRPDVQMSSLEEELRDAAEDPEKLERFNLDIMERYERFARNLESSDILSVVDNFFMPNGLESECYYFLGRIDSVCDYFNEMTGERFYRMNVNVNDVQFTAAVNEADLTGVPLEGYRIRAHGYLLGDVSD